eukprot:m.308568 g.308568  ORF g.308568 m.308568 type:complete len:1039 (+) comp44252_c0_seq1:1335-4451(+)
MAENDAGTAPRRRGNDVRLSPSLLDKIARLVVNREQMSALHDAVRTYPHAQHILMSSGALPTPRLILDAFLEAGCTLDDVEKILLDAGVDEALPALQSARRGGMTARSIAYRLPQQASAAQSMTGNSSDALASDSSTNFSSAEEAVLITIDEEPFFFPVVLGGTAAFFVGASCRSPYQISYQWFKGKTKVQGEKSSKLKIMSVTPDDRGHYCCRLSITERKYHIFTDWCELIITNLPRELELDHPSRRASVPKILRHPRSKSVNVGSTVELEANADGYPPPGYQWYKNGVAMKGKISRKLELKNVSLSDTASYCCAVSNENGGCFSNTAEIQVTEGLPDTVMQTQSSLPRSPVIQLQPQSKQMYEGVQLQLECRAIAAFTVQYEWYKNGNILPHQRGPVLTIQAVRSSDAGQYSCRTFTDEGLDSLSQLATVIVLQKASAPLPLAPSLNLIPQIKPSEQTTHVGGTVTFICYVSLPSSIGRPSDVLVSFQWFRSGRPLTLLSPNHNVLTLENVSFRDSGATFVCCVSDGKTVISSMPARLTVTETKSKEGLQEHLEGSVGPPRILKQPISFRGVLGSRVVFHCQAECPGGEPLMYQWLTSGFPGMRELKGATNPDFEVVISLFNALEYACRVTNRHGQSVTSKPARLFLAGASVTSSSTSSSATDADTSAMTSSFSSISFASSETTRPTSDPSSASNYSESTTTSFQESSSSARPGTGSVESPSLRETIKFETQPKCQQVWLGDALLLEVRVRSQSDVIFCWYQDGKPVFSGGHPAYYKQATTLQDAGCYYCVASNDFCQVASEEVLVKIRDPDVVKPPKSEPEFRKQKPALPTPPVFVKQPQGADVWVGDSFRLEARTVGWPEPSYLWLKIGADGLIHPIPGAQNQCVYDVYDAIGSDGGYYRCRADNVAGTSESLEVAVNVRDPRFVDPRRLVEAETEESEASGGFPYLPQLPPVFTKQPMSLDIQLGGTLRLEALASGMPYPRHMWYHNGNPLQGSGSLYVKKSAGVQDGGVYVCKAVNDAGDVTSEEVEVSVRP